MFKKLGGVLLAAGILLLATGATPAHAQVVAKGTRTYTWTANSGVYHVVRNYMNVDYTNHRLRFYGDNDTPYNDNINKTTSIHPWINSSPANVTFSNSSSARTFYVASSLYQCNGPARYQVYSDNFFSDTSDFPWNSGYIDTAC